MSSDVRVLGKYKIEEGCKEGQVMKGFQAKQRVLYLILELRSCCLNLLLNMEVVVA